MPLSSSLSLSHSEPTESLMGRRMNWQGSAREGSGIRSTGSPWSSVMRSCSEGSSTAAPSSRSSAAADVDGPGSEVEGGDEEEEAQN